MNKYTVSSIMLATLMLGGCGGSSHNTADKDASIPAALSKPKLTVNVKKRNKCGELVGYPLANIVFHGEDGSPLLIDSPNNSGFYSKELPEGAQSVSFVGLEGLDEYTKVRTIFTELDIANGAELNTIEFKDEMAYCDCRQVEVDFSPLAISHSQYYLSKEGGGSVSYFKDFPSLCGDNTKLYYTLTSPGYDFTTVAAIDVPKTMSKVVVDGNQFVHEGVLVATSSLEHGTQVYVNGKDNNDNEIFSEMDFVSDSTKLNIYPSVSETNELRNYAVSRSTQTGRYEMVYAGIKRRIKKDGKIGEVVLPTVPDELSGHLSAAKLALTQQMEFDYSFKTIDSRIQSAKWQFYFDSSEHNVEYTRWHVSGPLNATIPTLTYGDAFKATNHEVTRTHLHLSGFEGAPRDFSDYRQYLYTHADKATAGDNVFILLVSRINGETLIK
ncbi:hypothetical protein N474_10940 [Pseudoalteromonas luteoviolacea CPMOR-2]|uniref:Lipoprotein n=1 Tax=Pseudoalteromonas luteoviolacea DSM 6061 TaxID=1365250 RepID=A0A166VB50_9GAMM|nr:hypothetical protein [Pseudoalteromonas luteoviolacea]KZN32442.1 hypothetical protein N475_22435 [Pseudoalteromonas luteoviolacea DSM 6061]KZN56660.1 hypothetical protein N474_10940 [Pseudoalteromonas luteoviolacea CPMOR-2]MBE0386044.1 hypothetical protein [Pseudoalteromonas luteoviolacea DSM 6061]